MLKKKLGKKALAFASAAVMAVSATATGLTALSMTAFAGEELGEGTFENGKGLPWHICENATAVMKFDITDGIYAIKLENSNEYNYYCPDRKGWEEIGYFQPEIA